MGVGWCMGVACAARVNASKEVLSRARLNRGFLSSGKLLSKFRLHSCVRRYRDVHISDGGWGRNLLDGSGRNCL